MCRSAVRCIGIRGKKCWERGKSELGRRKKERISCIDKILQYEVKKAMRSKLLPCTVCPFVSTSFCLEEGKRKRNRADSCFGEK